MRDFSHFYSTLSLSPTHSNHFDSISQELWYAATCFLMVNLVMRVMHLIFMAKHEHTIIKALQFHRSDDMLNIMHV